MFLLDTNIVSDAWKQRGPAADWVRGSAPAQLFISVITLGEIARGAAMKARRDPQAATHITDWLARTRLDFGGRVLPITDDIAMEWGRLAAMRTRGDADGLIAATALVHRLQIVTRNVADFADTGAGVINPWET